MYKVSGTTILLTRGDTFKAKVRIFDSESKEYIPSENDSIKFALKKTPKDEESLIEKDIPFDTQELRIESEDTEYDNKTLTEDVVSWYVKVGNFQFNNYTIKPTIKIIEP